MKKSINILFFILSISLYSQNVRIGNVKVKMGVGSSYSYTSVKIGDVVIVPPSVPNFELTELTAFVGAEGAAKFITGGRGGQVVHVTNLNDSGAGSLRAALAITGPKIIVFDVAGIITLSSEIKHGTSTNTTSTFEDVTIAGETAPSPGITITGAEFGIQSGNIIMSYLTFRADETLTLKNAILARNWGADGYNLDGIYLNHLTISHGGNENLGFGAFVEGTRIKDVTIDYSMIGKTNGDGNILIGPNTQNVSLINNYLHDAKYRNALIGYGINDPLEQKEMINNVIFNAYTGPEIDRGLIVDVIANTFTSATGLPSNLNNFTLAPYYTAATGWTDTGAALGDGSYFVDGNIIQGLYTGGAGPYNSEILSESEVSRVYTGSTIASWETNRDSIAAKVLPTVGNSLYRETLDQTLIDNYYTETSDFTLPAKPTKTLTSRPAGYDTDNDGMPDEFETAYNITDKDGVKTFWNFGTYTITNTAGFTNIRMFLDFQAKRLDKKAGGLVGVITPE